MVQTIQSYRLEDMEVMFIVCNKINVDMMSTAVEDYTFLRHNILKFELFLVNCNKKLVFQADLCDLCDYEYFFSHH